MATVQGSAPQGLSCFSCTKNPFLCVWRCRQGTGFTSPWPCQRPQGARLAGLRPPGEGPGSLQRVVEDGWPPTVWALEDLGPEEEQALQAELKSVRAPGLGIPGPDFLGCCWGLANDYQETGWHARTFGERGPAAGGGSLCVQSLACDVTTLSRGTSCSGPSPGQGSLWLIELFLCLCRERTEAKTAAGAWREHLPAEVRRPGPGSGQVQWVLPRCRSLQGAGHWLFFQGKRWAIKTYPGSPPTELNIERAAALRVKEFETTSNQEGVPVPAPRDVLKAKLGLGTGRSGRKITATPVRPDTLSPAFD